MNRLAQDCIETLKAQDEQIAAIIKDVELQGLNWKPIPGINSIYVLISHIAGSRNFWINQVIGGDDIHRDRDAEFKTWGQDRQPLLRKLQEVTTQCLMTLERLAPDESNSIRRVRDREYSVRWCMLHAIEHSGYHIGQIKLLERQLSQNGGKR